MLRKLTYMILAMHSLAEALRFQCCHFALAGIVHVQLAQSYYPEDEMCLFYEYHHEKDLSWHEISSIDRILLVPSHKLYRQMLKREFWCPVFEMCQKEKREFAQVILDNMFHHESFQVRRKQQAHVDENFKFSEKYKMHKQRGQPTHKRIKIKQVELG